MDDSEEKPEVRFLSQDEMWRMKRESQERGRRLLADGKLKPEDILFLRPHRLKDAVIYWPELDSLLDKDEENH